MLRFPAEIEREYDDDHFARWLTTRRLSFTIGLVAAASFTAADFWAAPHHLGQILILRAIACSSILALLVLSFTPHFRRVSEPTIAICLIVAGGAIAGMEIAMSLDDPGYELYLFGMAIVLFYGFTATGLEFWPATATGTVMLAFSVAVTIDHHPEHDMVHMVLLEALVVGAYAVGMAACLFIDTGGRRNFLQERRLDRERARSEALLLNILPAPVADRLKRGETIADRYDEVTVLFADLVSFTQISQRMDPGELIAFLDHLFTRVDRLASAHGLEKIKTIGDSYMAVCGLPKARPDTARPAADMAIAMLDVVSAERHLWDIDARLRIGMHTGPVVAGVLGVHKFSYDLWGDTVNIASRMESSATPDEIQITEQTHDRLGEAYRFEGPRFVDVKGKGMMTTYRLVGTGPARRTQADLALPTRSV